jgi:hypothetical protein
MQREIGGGGWSYSTGLEEREGNTYPPPPPFSYLKVLVSNFRVEAIPTEICVTFLQSFQPDTEKS